MGVDDMRQSFALWLAMGEREREKGERVNEKNVIKFFLLHIACRTQLHFRTHTHTHTEENSLNLLFE